MLAVTDIRLPEKCRTALSSRGFSIVTLPPFSALDVRVASHPDMLILPLGNRLFVHKDYYTEARTVIDKIIAQTSLSLILNDDVVGAEYPRDISLNLVVSGNYILGRCDSIAKAVAAHAKSMNIQLVNTNQGYAKCSALVLGDKALITADPTIAHAGRSISLDVLRVSEGHITLDGYDHGFIGGASGVYGNAVFFCGDVLSHPDGNVIVDFCRAHGFDVLSLSDEPLCDMGTIFFLRK